MAVWPSISLWEGYVIDGSVLITKYLLFPRKLSFVSVWPPWVEVQPSGGWNAQWFELFTQHHVTWLWLVFVFYLIINASAPFEGFVWGQLVFTQLLCFHLVSCEGNMAGMLSSKILLFCVTDIFVKKKNVGWLAAWSPLLPCPTAGGLGHCNHVWISEKVGSTLNG